MKALNYVLTMMALFVYMTSNAQTGVTNYGTNSGTQGSYNTNVGDASGRLSTSSYGSMFGYQSGNDNTIGMSNSFFGYRAGFYNVAGSNNNFFGTNAGRNNISGNNNCFFGSDAGYSSTSGTNNSFFGHESGTWISTGICNVATGTLALRNVNANHVIAIGYAAGHGVQGNAYGDYNIFMGSLAAQFAGGGSSNNTIIGHAAASLLNFSSQYCVFIGERSHFTNYTSKRSTSLGYMSGAEVKNSMDNVFIGYKTSAGIAIGNNDNTTISSQNVIIGAESGFRNISSKNSVYLGYKSGNQNQTGNGNVFIGSNSGFNEMGSNKLYISNSSTPQPLIYGEFDTKILKMNGKMAINTQNMPTTIGGVSISNYSLFVKGGILTEEIRVRTGWADYVFDNDYKLMELSELENYIKANNHLPNVPSAEEVNRQGLEIGDITKIQQEKIEELTLYTIKQQKEIDELKSKLEQVINTLQKN